MNTERTLALVQAVSEAIGRMSAELDVLRQERLLLLSNHPGSVDAAAILGAEMSARNTHRPTVAVAMGAGGVQEVQMVRHAAGPPLSPEVVNHVDLTPEARERTDRVRASDAAHDAEH